MSNQASPVKVSDPPLIDGCLRSLSICSSSSRGGGQASAGGVPAVHGECDSDHETGARAAQPKDRRSDLFRGTEATDRLVLQGISEVQLQTARRSVRALFSGESGAQVPIRPPCPDFTSGGRRLKPLFDAIEEANRLPFGFSPIRVYRVHQTAAAVGSAVESGMVWIDPVVLSLPESTRWHQGFWHRF